MILRPKDATEGGLAHLSDFTTVRPTHIERLAAGKALRKDCSRASHAVHVVAANRPDPVDVLTEQNKTRIPYLIPVRMGRMLASPFAFLRGSAAVMAADLAPTPVSGLDVMACGDMHLLNFGVFGSAERNLIFSINDFDEAHPGAWEWDLKRLAASAAVAAQHLGCSRSDSETAAQAVVRSYVQHMRRYSEMSVLETWYDQIDEASILKVVPADLRKATEAILAKAQSRGHMRSLERLTAEVDGQPRLIEDNPIIVRETHLSDGTPVPIALDQLLEQYMASLTEERQHLLRRYRIVDVVRKVVGVGSVGTGCWVILLTEHSTANPLFLQVKQAGPSVLAPYATRQSPVSNEGQRVVLGQRLIQGSPDIFLGWGATEDRPDRHFYVRQLADMKGSLRLVENDERGVRPLLVYLRLCGWALALAHAKSGDAARISGYCGRSDAMPEALGKYALAYMEQTERDFEALVQAGKQGKFPVEYGA